ncbi:MAG TPA: hypothetical protein VEU32_14580, partial [Burkholderiales bacterium]|nr:hypothetical protein [Burkholderiales bacterium]
IPINQAVGGCLLVCMSTCEGYAGTCMAMEPNGEHPFFALVGNSGKPTWGDTATAFLSFYHLFAKGHYLADAVSGMRVASGDEAFFLRTAEDAKRGYIEYLEKLASGQETLSPIDTGLAPAGLLGSAERKGSLETVAAAAS